MAQATLNWIPAGGNSSVEQQVQYRLKGAGTWSTASVVGTAINTSTITGLSENTIYQYQVVNICSSGGATPSNMTEGILLTCPVVTLSNVTHYSVDYSFAALGGDVTSYDIQLLDANGTLIGTENKATAATVTGTISTLSAASSYSLRVVPKAGTYSKSDCTAQAFTTTVAPSCGIPTSVSATMS